MVTYDEMLTLHDSILDRVRSPWSSSTTTTRGRVEDLQLHDDRCRCLVHHLHAHPITSTGSTKHHDEGIPGDDKRIFKGIYTLPATTYLKLKNNPRSYILQMNTNILPLRRTKTPNPSAVSPPMTTKGREWFKVPLPNQNENSTNCRCLDPYCDGSEEFLVHKYCYTRFPCLY